MSEPTHEARGVHECDGTCVPELPSERIIRDNAEPDLEIDMVTGARLLLEFRDKYGRTWIAGALASPIHLRGLAHDPEDIRFSLDSVEAMEELGMRLVNFSPVLDG
jgi:hypothetical protein